MIIPKHRRVGSVTKDTIIDQSQSAAASYVRLRNFETKDRSSAASILWLLIMNGHCDWTAVIDNFCCSGSFPNNQLVQAAYLSFFTITQINQYAILDHDLVTKTYPPLSVFKCKNELKIYCFHNQWPKYYGHPDSFTVISWVDWIGWLNSISAFSK